MKKKIVFILLLILSLTSLLFIYNDDFLYKTDIMKIQKISNTKTEESSNPLGLKEKYYYKKITGVITNGKNKGKNITIKYEETYSSVVTDRYRVNDKVFVKNKSIEGLKRDFYLAILIVIFLLMIYVVGNFKGLLSILSLILNIIIFYIGLELYFKGFNILIICIIESFVFSILSLFISNGINKKSFSAVLSVVVSITILLLMLLIISKITNYKGINFNEISFLTVPPEDIILPELLIGTIGAVMDVAITISSAISELIDKDKNISAKSLKLSAKQIGKDIMSTMSNVLFFTYLCAGLPIFVLAIRNGFSFYNYITTNFSLELTRFLVGSIGIVMTIPITTFISVKIFKEKAHE